MGAIGDEAKLPLKKTRVGFEPTNSKELILSQPHLTTLLPCHGASYGDRTHDFGVTLP
jgi:hypothetical protein